MRRLIESVVESLFEKRLNRTIKQPRYSELLIGCSLVLCFCTCWLLWNRFGWASCFQTIFILLISVLGENYISGRGYYRYSESNCYFVGRVPIWIPFMWISVIQGSLLVVSLTYPFNLMVIPFSGVMCSLIDLSIIEPYFCRRKMLWSWSPVENGYFDFIPENLHRFTAPPGNYITWFIFPVISNALLFLFN